VLPYTKFVTRRSIVVATVLSLAFIATVWLIRRPKTFLGALHLPPDRFIVNLPVRHGVNAGTLVTNSTDGLMVIPQADAPAVVEKKIIGADTGWVQLPACQSTSGTGLSTILCGPAPIRRELRLSDITQDSVSNEALTPEQAEVAKDLAAVRRPVLQVTRSIKAKIILRLTKTHNASVADWGRVLETIAEYSRWSLSEAEFRQQNFGDRIELAIERPVVIAYELADVSSGRRLDKSSVEANRILASRKNEPTAPPEKAWGLVTVSLGEYTKLRSLNQSWNQWSAELVARRFESYAPAWQDRFPTRPAPTAGNVLAHMQAVAQRIRATNVQFVVVYIIGHALTDDTGELYVVGSDADPSSVRGEQETNSDSRSERPGLVRLRELYAALGEANRPFVLLVDGCMLNKQFQEFVSSLSLQYSPASPNLFYIGASSNVYRQLSSLGNGLTHFSDKFPYLKGSDPVVLSAKPGTLAEAKPNPTFELGPPVGPLAAKIDRVLRINESKAARPSLDEIIRQFADFTGVVGTFD